MVGGHLSVRSRTLLPTQGLMVPTHSVNTGSLLSTGGVLHYLGPSLCTNVVNPMGDAPEIPPSSKPRPTATRKSLGKCSNCGQTGHKSESPVGYLTFSHFGNFQTTESARRCPKYASDPLHPKATFLVEPTQDLCMSYPDGRRFKSQKCQFTWH